MINEYKWKDFLKLIYSTKPKVRLFIIAITISSISAIISTFIPNTLKNLIDLYSSTGNISKVTLLMLSLLFLIGTLLGALASYLLSFIGLNVVATLRETLWNKIIKLPTEYFDKNESGDIASRVVNDTTVIYNLVTNSLSQFINAILIMMFCGFWLFYYDWQLSLFIVLAIPVYLLLFIPLGRILAKLSNQIQISTARLNINSLQMISENKLIKSFTAEKSQINKGLDNILKLKNIGLKQSKWMSIVNPVLNLITMTIIIFIIGYGGVKLSNGDLSTGTFIAFLTLLFYVIGPITNFGSFFSQLQKTKGATERISQLLNVDTENLTEGIDLKVSDKDLEIKKLGFKYSTQKDLPFALKDINVTIKGGKTHALVGPSGSGKTTLISLLERLYSPTSGTINFDSKNIKEYSLTSWRSLIGYVSQEHSLISGTIKENLLFGIEDEPLSEIKLIKACKSANAWEFIKDLPKGLDTNIGEKGLNLSGGQRQRIAIARVFMKNPQIIFLDEATANLDSESEKKVQFAMNEIIKDRTVIIIAHRLSTIKNADEIFFLENGEITGRGNHLELQQSHPLYKKFCEQQLQIR